jgi:phytoene dehydrogenase-like protein
MTDPKDIIIGAGHNGLVAACFLARAGLKPLVLERREILGGTAVTEEIHPGFRCPTLMHAAGSPMHGLAQELDLGRHGLEAIQPDVRVYSPSLDAHGIVLYEDAERTAADLARVSTKDAAKYKEFIGTFGKIGKFLRPILSMTPPSIDSPSLAEVLKLLGVGARFRGLGSKDGYRLLRWGPMAVADLVAEWFETDLLRATVAARGVFGCFAGPWSAGTSLGLLVQAALDGHAVAPSLTFRGGIGALSAALASAARAAGAEVRTSAHVERITSKDGHVTSVVLEGGEEIPARAVISSADPKTTFLRLVDPLDLDPDFVHKMRNYRCFGAAAKINYALSGIPAFVGAGGGAGGANLLKGRIHIGPGIDYLERAFDAAKYGDYSPHPVLDITIPSLADPSLAPSGAQVMSVHVQYAPYKLNGGGWASRREALADSVGRTLSEYAPGFPSLVLQRQVLTPADIESAFGLSGGHVFHGEQALDQLFTMRPLLGWARYRAPITGLYLCGAGTHPGGGITGAPGANAAREIIKDLRR